MKTIIPQLMIIMVNIKEKKNKLKKPTQKKNTTAEEINLIIAKTKQKKKKYIEIGRKLMEKESSNVINHRQDCRASEEDIKLNKATTRNWIRKVALDEQIIQLLMLIVYSSAEMKA
uniref:Uncharacterized protein n=1 Tax=Anopheles arabiensis TaxID=7173 RepID=A0A182IFQ1_ANOAR